MFYVCVQAAGGTDVATVIRQNKVISYIFISATGILYQYQLQHKYKTDCI